MYCIIVFSSPVTLLAAMFLGAICGADCVPYLWWLYHNFSLNCCHLWSISPAFHFASICIILLCFFYFIFQLKSNHKTATHYFKSARLGRSRKGISFLKQGAHTCKKKWTHFYSLWVFVTHRPLKPDTTCLTISKNTWVSVKPGGSLLICISERPTLCR